MADYSDDMVEQFMEASGLSLAVGVRPKQGVETPADRIPERADYIWRTHRREWCEFYATRFELLYTKVCRAMHGMGREVILNNAWTRDPFEAYDRYGIDYRRIERAGVDRFIMEAVGAGASIGAESGHRADPRHEFNFMLTFTKAYVPDTPLLCLNGTGDTTENWDVLNHAPPVSEREIYTLGHMFLRGAEGFRHASAGPVVCLADGIDRGQWAWLGLWNVLTWGKTGSDGLAWFKASVKQPTADPRYHVDLAPSHLTDQACAEHRFFVPLNGAVVFDHLVSYDRLRGIPLLFLTGKHVSNGTTEAVRQRVAEGALCVAWGPLASASGFPDWAQGVQIVRHGRGRFVITDDLESAKAVRHYRRFLGDPDEIRYRFTGRTVVLRRTTDNSVAVQITDTGYGGGQATH